MVPGARHPLVQVRRDRGWSQQGLADRLCALGATRGVNIATTKRTVSTWENGRHEPDPPAQQLLAVLFGVADGDRAAIPWPEWIPVERPDLYAPWTVRSTVAALEGVQRSAHMDRRAFLTITGGTLSAVLHGWLTADPEAAHAVTRGRRVGSALLTRIEAHILELQHADDALGGGDLLGETDAALALVTHLLGACTYTDAQARRLFAAAADLGRMAAWGRFDVGRHAAAQTCYHAALRAAQTSGDRQLGANTLAFMAIQAYSTGHPRDADNLVRTAQTAVRGNSTPAIDAMLAARRARALSKTGDAGACFRELNRAADLVGDGPGEDDPPWAYWIMRPEILMLTGSCMLDLGDPKRAQELFTEADRTYGDDYTRTHVLYLSRMSTALVQQGKIEAACAHGDHALDLLDEINSGRGLDHVRDTVTLLAPHRNVPAVRDYLDKARNSPALRTA